MASFKTLNKIVIDFDDLIFTIDTAGKLSWVNQASKRILENTPSELKGRAFSEILHPDNLPKWKKS